MFTPWVPTERTYCVSGLGILNQPLVYSESRVATRQETAGLSDSSTSRAREA